MNEQKCKYRCPYEQRREREKREKNECNKLIGMVISIAGVFAFLRFGCRPTLQTIVDYQQQYNQTKAVQTYKPRNKPKIAIVPSEAGTNVVVSKDSNSRQENSNLETKVVQTFETNNKNTNNAGYVVNDVNNLSPVNYGEQKNEPKKKIIVLDPGHGMSNNSDNNLDPGAIYPIKSKNPIFREEGIVLEQAKRIKQMLEAKGYIVYLTREDNEKPTPLYSRTKLAKELNADLLVSLHCNSFGDESVYGQEVHQNSGGKSELLANCILFPLTKEIGKKSKTRNKGIKYSDFAVLKTSIPSVLVEAGFLSNENDRGFLTDNNPNVETAIANSIINYLDLEKTIENRVTESNKKHRINLDPDLIRAKILVESSGSEAFNYDLMQIANEVCPALEVLANGEEHTYLIGDFSFLKGKRKTPLVNGKLDYSQSNMDIESSIRGGIGWLLHKAAIYNERIVEEGDLQECIVKKGDSFWKIAKEKETTVETLKKYNPYVDPEKLQIGEKLAFKQARKEMYIAGWRSWEEAVARYNGGGDPNYLEKVYTHYKTLKNSKN